MLYTIYNIENKEVQYCQDFDNDPILELPLAFTKKLNTQLFNKEMFDGKNFYEGEPFPIEKYIDEINKLHNLLLDDLLNRKNYLSLGEVQLWIDDENYGLEATQIIEWYKSTYKLIVAHLETITIYQNPQTFIESLPILN